MGIKADVVRQLIDISGNLIADQLSKPDWESRKANIEQYYRDLQPIRETLPDAPSVREIAPNANANANDRIVDEICTPDLSPKELSECREGVEEVLKDPSVVAKYLKSSATG